MTEFERLQAKVGALEYLVKYLLALPLTDAPDAVERASGFAGHIRTTLEQNRPDHIDEATFMEISHELVAILDDWVATMKRDRQSR